MLGGTPQVAFSEAAHSQENEPFVIVADPDALSAGNREPNGIEV